MAKKIKEHYVDNEKLLEEIMKYKEQVKRPKKMVKQNQVLDIIWENHFLRLLLTYQRSQILRIILSVTI